MEIVTNADGTMTKEQSDLMNNKAAILLKEVFKILSEVDTLALQNPDEKVSNSVLNDVARQIFNKISEEDIVRVFHASLGEAASSIVQTAFYKVKQLEEGLEHGLIENLMGVQMGCYDEITLKEMVAKLSEVQKKD